MKILALALLLLNLTSDDLVTAAKASKEKRKKSTTKVITNADVKKAKGTVVQTTAPATPVEAPKEKSLVEQYETSYRDRLVHDEKLAAATRKVADLEKELAAIEQSYYEENDLDKRDKEIVKRFNDTKAKLDQARKELEGLAPTPAPEPPTTTTSQ